MECLHHRFPMVGTLGSVVVQGIAVVVCISWIWVNAYHFYPMIATAFSSSARRVTPSSRTETSLPDGGLPTIDVLLPAYQESAVIEHSIESVREAEYPQDKLTLAVLIEPDDDETRRELERIEGEYEFTTITVPEEYPGSSNKPRALNYGFEQTDGDIVSITDAEDVVHPQLYRRVVETFELQDADYVQGRLDMINEDDGWMNTLFRAEYGYWYKVNTRAKYTLGYPIPLGGTTCFIPRELLREMSDDRLEEYADPWTAEDQEWVREHGLQGWRPWDPNNVTEDFELGLRLWQNGYRAGFVNNTPTDEESPLSFHSWIRQRTRWQKGKIYTFIQYLRHPPDSLREKLHVYTQSAVPHLGPVNLMSVLVLVLVANLFGFDFHPITETVLVTVFLLAVVVIGLYSYGYWVVSDRSLATRLRRTLAVGLTLPVYWFMQWLADLRAIKQTYTGQHHWAKTDHFGRNVQADGGVGTNGGLMGLTTAADERTDGPSRWKLSVGLVTTVLVGVGLRAYELDGWSFFADELYSVVARGSLPPLELVTVPLALDSHPPLYYLLLHYWMELFGNSVASARAMSVAFSVGAMLMLFLLGTELYDGRVGLVATMLFSVSTFHVHYGRIARMYSLFAFLTLASWYGFVKLRTDSRGWVAAYALATAALVYTHVFALLVVAAQHAYVLMSETKAGISWRRWAIAQATFAALVLPWLFVLGDRAVSLVQGGTEGGIIGWIREPGLSELTSTALRYAGYPTHYPLFSESWSAHLAAGVLVIVFSGCLVFAAFRVTRDDEYQFADLPRAAQLSTLLVVPIAVPFVASHLLVPLYSPRFTTPASLALFLLVAAGIVNLARSHRAVAAVVLVVVLASSFALAGQYHTGETVEDWEGAATCLGDAVDDGEAVLYQPFWAEDRLDYYSRPDGAETYGVLPPDEVTADHGYALNLTELDERVNGHDVVWLVQFQPDVGNRLLSTLTEEFRTTLSADYGALDVYRLERGNGTPARAKFAGVTDTGTSPTDRPCDD